MLVDKVCRLPIHRWIQRSNHSSTNARKSSRTRRTGKTKRLIDLVKRRVRFQSTRKTSRTMAKDFRISSFFWKVDYKIIERFLLEQNEVF